MLIHYKRFLFASSHYIFYLLVKVILHLKVIIYLVKDLKAAIRYYPSPMPS